MLDKIKKDIEKEFSKICEYNDECEKKQEVLQANTNDSKMIKRTVIGFLSLIPSIIGSLSLMPILLEVSLPATMMMSIAVSSSIVVGCTGQAIITSFTKRKMNKFTEAKTNADILEEMIYYEMEINKSKNKKETLRKMYENIESKQKILTDYSSEFIQIDKYENLTFDDLKKRQEILLKAYEERIEQLDVLTSQSYLKNKFKLYRKKSGRIENIISSALIISLPFCFFIGTPFMTDLIKNIGVESALEFSKIIAVCFSPTLIVTPIALPYFIKRNKDIMNSFHNLNKSLGENALLEKPDIEYEKELDNIISIKMGEIVELGIELKEVSYTIEKRGLETITKRKDKSKEKSCPNLMDVEEEIKHYIPESPAQLFDANENTEEQPDDLQHNQTSPKLVKRLIPTRNTKNK